jgi:uncharacterized membrane protein
LALALIGVDFTGSKQLLARWSRLFGVGADGARGMLSTIAGSMMTVVGGDVFDGSDDVGAGIESIHMDQCA